jgi:hypothetical protein
VLTVDGKDFSQPLRVEADPAYPSADVIVEEVEEHDEDDDDADREGAPIDGLID